MQLQARAFPRASHTLVGDIFGLGRVVTDRLSPVLNWPSLVKSGRRWVLTGSGR